MHDDSIFEARVLMERRQRMLDAASLVVDSIDERIELAQILLEMMPPPDSDEVLLAASEAAVLMACATTSSMRDAVDATKEIRCFLFTGNVDDSAENAVRSAFLAALTPKTVLEDASSSEELSGRSCGFLGGWRRRILGAWSRALAFPDPRTSEGSPR